MKQPLSCIPAVAAADRGRAFFTGSARRRASKSGGRPWTRQRSAGSKNTTPTSNSTGPRSSRHSRLRPRLPKTRAIAADAAIGRVPRGPRRGSVPHRRRLQQSRPSVKTRSHRTWSSWNWNPRNQNFRNRNSELEPELEPDPLELEPAEIAQAFEQLTHPEAEEAVEPPAMPVEQQVGREQLTRLRARYAELLTRIAERGGDVERIEALRAQAESLNPDTWVTEEEVRQGIDSFEPKIRDLRAALGLRRRRRSRRGGRRRRGGAGEGGAPPAAGPENGGDG